MVEKGKEAASSAVDNNDPYYLHSSDHPGVSLVPEVFDGQNFGEWKISVITSLSAKNKLDFINGALARPKADDAMFGRWIRCNNMVKSWLVNSLNAEIRRSVIYTEAAKEIWDELNVRFGQRSGAQLFSVKKELGSLTQGSNSVSTYFTQMKSLWDEIGNLKQVPRCSCTEGLKDYKKNEDEDKLLQFLMGLNESYKSTRGSLLMMVPPPDINQAYSLILQEEKQRDIHLPSQIGTESASMYANSRSGNTSSQKPRSDRKNLFCTNCKKTNHTADRCYFLIGFPPNYKENKGNAQKSGQNEKLAATVQSQASTTLTPEQITKLLTLLDAGSGGKGKEHQHDDFAGFAGSFFDGETGDWGG